MNGFPDARDQRDCRSPSPILTAAGEFVLGYVDELSRMKHAYPWIDIYGLRRAIGFGLTHSEKLAVLDSLVASGKLRVAWIGEMGFVAIPQFADAYEKHVDEGAAKKVGSH